MKNLTAGIGLMAALSGSLAACSADDRAYMQAKDNGAYCAAGENVLFACQASTAKITLCHTPRDGTKPEILSLQVTREGNPSQRIMLRSHAGEERRFFATAMPLLPRAIVRQVWTDDGNHRYLVAQCVGGDCPFRAGYVSIFQGVVDSAAICSSSDDPTAGTFQHGIVEFGDGHTDGKSLTPAIEYDLFDNPVEEIANALSSPEPSVPTAR